MIEGGTDTDDEASGLIRIELRMDDSMPTGRAIAVDGGKVGFTGWVGLMSAVDALAATGDANRTGEEGSGL